MGEVAVAVTVERVPAESEEAQGLTSRLWQELDQLYGNLSPTPSILAGMNEPGAAFVIARDGGNAVGCAALRPLTAGVAEVKRMYVEPAARKKGIARAIMHALEQMARDSGFSEIWLETGQLQSGAIHLYESLGYTRIAAFGDYQADPLSLSFGKSLK